MIFSLTSLLNLKPIILMFYCRGSFPNYGLSQSQMIINQYLRKPSQILFLFIASRTREYTINIFQPMRVLIVIVFLLCSLGSIQTTKYHRFFVFTRDGTFYKLDPLTKQVQWHNILPFKLLSLDISTDQHQENETKKYFIPTIDGDFLYLEQSLFDTKYKQILVPRSDLEHLLDVCFDSKGQQKYFVYQKMEYFVLNTQNGLFHPLEDYFNEKSIFNKSIHTILIVSRKLLKQLSSRMQVKWNVISSKINMLNIEEFVLNSKILQKSHDHPYFSFLRLDHNTVEILDEFKNTLYEIKTSSSILNIFVHDINQNIVKAAIKYPKRKMLALPEGVGKSAIGHEISQIFEDQDRQFQNFPHSGEIRQAEKSDLDHLDICIRTQKLIKQISFQNPAKIISNPPKIQFTTEKSILDKDQFDSIEYHYTSQFDPKDLPTFPFSSDKRIHIIVTKQQPFVYIFLITIIIGGGILFYRFKVNKLWQQISQMQNISDQNMKKITAKLGQYQNVGKQLKKMYEIQWDNLLYKQGSYYIFGGRFLNQSADVFMIPIMGYDIIDIQHKLNILINCSHKGISKLYYYTRNDDSLLIFCQSSPSYKKLTDLTEKQNEIFVKLSQDQQTYKNTIKIIMETIEQIMGQKIEITSFAPSSILISNKFDVKINIVPTFLLKECEEQEKKFKEIGTSRFRVDLIKIIHKLGHHNSEFDLLAFEKEKNTQNEENSFLKDFYDHFLLTEHNPNDINALKSAIKHPFLWDSKQKMLFVCDFSNYVETCIDDQKIMKMESHCKNFQIISLPWNGFLHPLLAKQLNNYRKYDFNSSRDLIRLIRNKISHFHQIPKQTRLVVGKSPEQFVQYFLASFPKLLSFMYVYASKKKWKLNSTQ